MTTRPAHDGEPGEQEPAEGSRATVEGALAGASEEDRTPYEEAEQGVSDQVPDA